MSTETIERVVSELPPGQQASARESLQQIRGFGIPADLFDVCLNQVSKLRSELRNPAGVIGDLRRFLAASRSPLAWLSLFEREPDSFTMLVTLLSASPYVAGLLVRDPETFDFIRVTDGQPIERSILQDEIVAEIRNAADLRSMLRILRTYRNRETMRIAYGDLVKHQSVDVVLAQLAILAESIVEAAMEAAYLELSRSGRSQPKHSDGVAISISAIGLGDLGGSELNYTGQLELILIRESHRGPNSRDAKAAEILAEDYFQRFGELTQRLLSEATTDGFAYRLAPSIGPPAARNKLVASYSQAVRHYDTAGRTWERQAFLKARAFAGDLLLGEAFIQDLQPWVYRRYLMPADITGLIALKRRIQRHSAEALPGTQDILFGQGGVWEIQSALQLLQLLHGADKPQVRCRPTLELIDQLRAVACLTTDQATQLEDNYRFLRRVEHHLEMLSLADFASAKHDQETLEKLAMGLQVKAAPEHVGTELVKQVTSRTQCTHSICSELIETTFAAREFDESQIASSESDLLLDPKPSPSVIQSTLQPYGFRKCAAAYGHLQELAIESIPFLSTRRSRHYLAAIAPQLLASIGQTPDPDRTLVNLSNVSNSLGGKAVLWELFNKNPPSMELCVRICAASPYLTGILTGNPGMIDELLDSLMVAGMPTQEMMAASLERLCRGVVDIAPILHRFKNSMHLRIGVRDILGKSTIEETHAALAAVAEACIEQVVQHEFHRLVHRFGVPTTDGTDGRQEGADLVVLATGKLGGREPNYHSDLDLLFLFDGEGSTTSLIPNHRFRPTTNRHFFNQLCQNIIHALTRSGATGRLYDVDVSLRPLGESGPLAITIQDLQQHFGSGRDRIWERQALCKARPIWGSPRVRERALSSIHEVLQRYQWSEDDSERIYQHRLQLERTASPDNLKRGAGGTMDIEFVVQLLQLAYASKLPQVLVPGTLLAVEKLQEARALPQEIASRLRLNYECLRNVESGIRLMNLAGRHELPSSPADLEQLAFLLRAERSMAISGAQLQDRCQRVLEDNRTLFAEIFESWRPQELLGEDG